MQSYKEGGEYASKNRILLFFFCKYFVKIFNLFTPIVFEINIVKIRIDIYT